MNRLKAYFSDVDIAANLLSCFFSASDEYLGACFRCPCKAACKSKSDSYCEDVIAEWLEGEA